VISDEKEGRIFGLVRKKNYLLEDEGKILTIKGGRICSFQILGNRRAIARKRKILGAGVIIGSGDTAKGGGTV